MKLSEAEQEALDWLKAEGGSMLISNIPDKNEKTVFGGIEPGMAVFKKLEKKGLIFFTEEEPFELEPDLWFTFTEEVYLVTDAEVVTT